MHVDVSTHGKEDAASMVVLIFDIDSLVGSEVPRRGFTDGLACHIPETHLRATYARLGGFG